jgi:hypothetical protein
MAQDKSNSLLRKFSIIFVGVALIPFIILFYLHSLYDESHRFIQILDTNFSLIIGIVGVISLLGFFGMRMAIKKINLLTEIVKKAAIDKEDEKIILELTEEGGEVGELAKSFIYALSGVSKKEQESQKTKEMIYDILKKASEVLAVVNNYDNLIQLVLETAVDALGAKRGALFSADNGRYILKTWVGSDNVIEEEIIGAARIYLDQMARQNRFFLISGQDKGEQSDNLLPLPLLFSPLEYNNNLYGVLCFSGNNYWNNFSNEHKFFVSSLSHQIAISLDNAQINTNT